MITFSGFRKALKDANLPNSKHTIIKYERLGIISYPKNPMRYGTRTDRTYSDAEIRENIAKIKKHRHGVEFEGKNKGGRPRKEKALSTHQSHRGNKKKD